MARASLHSGAASAFGDDQDRQRLDALIQQHLDQRLGPYLLLPDKAAYIQAAHTLPDTATEYFCILAKAALPGHHWLWLHVIARLAQISNALLHQRQLLAATLDIHVTGATAFLAPVWQQVARHAETLFDAADAAFLLADSRAQALFCACVDAAMRLCAADQAPLKHGLLVASAGRAVARYFAAGQAQPQTDLYRLKLGLVAPLVALAQAAVVTGVPRAVLPLMFPAAPAEPAVSETALPHVVLDPAVSLGLITDYYRYFAFCLVTSVVEAAAIDDVLTSKADVFLRVLLALPHLHLSNYMTDAVGVGAAPQSTQPRVVSPAAREEIAFFYLLNCLLRLRSLPQFAAPPQTFTSERRFFVASFNKRCGAELDFSASASLSRTGSVVSMTRMADPSPLHVPPAHVMLSCVLTEGTYKEKVRLVAEFISLAGDPPAAGSVKCLVETFDMSALHQRTNNFAMGAHDVLRLVHRIDPQQYPGKVLYVKAIDMVVRLLQLVALKHFIPVFNCSLSPAELLARLFKTNYLLRDVLLVKDLLCCDSNELLSVQHRGPLSEHDLLSAQFRLLETTRMLKNDVQKLI
ncbi:hypothetical protein METBIDRAFT_83143 [Metschnikowia bicuspidata var. bicuspidata NRRL YB-4993]|uniref:Uncharacterized protein n=1 Tax=Metschnikowia bicuspidata var. bicuspidata NRRL YB-4993 TaxID=869754 RepID=A0A1A0HC54_9ASCO|nr:hypothetical protein METBIDRAFT_83143 [Metschnikowia bicuspidata var. bicuspidata NRRL YB-4993]OBA21565.1 hypothetical protein METBIDRAFT_83143 [Metschnikowia bicuspidata var. bicuspidata NRRL YB-4993]